MSAIDAHPFPRAALLAAAVLIGITLASVSVVRIANWNDGPPGMQAGMEDTSPVRDQRLVAFLERQDQSLEVVDAATGAVIWRVAAGEGGFVRGLLRALWRDRLPRAIPAESPYRIIAFADGRLAVEDPTTGRRIDAGAFGADNRATIAGLLTQQDPS